MNLVDGDFNIFFRCRTGLDEDCSKSVNAGYLDQETADELAAKEKFCTNPCFPGNRTHLYRCKLGTEGRSCARCSEGWFRFGRDCYECSDEHTDWNHESNLRLIYFFVVLPTFYCVRKVATSVFMKTNYTLFTYLQLLSLQGAFRIKWHNDIKVVMRWTQVVNFNVDLLIPSCYREPSYLWKYSFFFMMPIIFMSFDILQEVVEEIWHHRTKFYRFFGIPCEGVPEYQPGEMTIWQKTISHILVDARLMYVTLCSRTMEMVACTSRSASDYDRYTSNSFLTRDPEIDCWVGNHKDTLPLAYAAFVVYVAGIPLAYIYLLHHGKQSDRLYKDPIHVKQFGRIYARFERPYFWWELIMYCRRLLCVMIKVLLNDRRAYKATSITGQYQAMATMVVLSTAICGQMFFRPFQDSFHDVQDAVYTVCLICYILIGWAFGVADDDGNTDLYEQLRDVWMGVFTFSILFTGVGWSRDYYIYRKKILKLKVSSATRKATLLNKFISAMGLENAYGSIFKKMETENRMTKFLAMDAGLQADDDTGTVAGSGSMKSEVNLTKQDGDSGPTSSKKEVTQNVREEQHIVQNPVPSFLICPERLSSEEFSSVLAESKAKTSESRNNVNSSNAETAGQLPPIRDPPRPSGGEAIVDVRDGPVEACTPGAIGQRAKILHDRPEDSGYPL